MIIIFRHRNDRRMGPNTNNIFFDIETTGGWGLIIIIIFRHRNDRRLGPVGMGRGPYLASVESTMMPGADVLCHMLRGCRAMGYVVMASR